MSAMITMAAQNYPRGSELNTQGSCSGAALVAGIGAVATALSELCPGWMLGLFTDDGAVVAVGITYLRYFALGFIAENVMFCSSEGQAQGIPWCPFAAR